MRCRDISGSVFLSGVRKKTCSLKVTSWFYAFWQVVLMVFSAYSDSISYLHEFVSSARMAAVEFFDNRELNVVDFSAWYKKFQLCFQIFAEVREMSAFLLRQRQWFPQFQNMSLKSCWKTPDRDDGFRADGSMSPASLRPPWCTEVSRCPRWRTKRRCGCTTSSWRTRRRLSTSSAPFRGQRCYAFCSALNVTRWKCRMNPFHLADSRLTWMFLRIFSNNSMIALNYSDLGFNLIELPENWVWQNARNSLFWKILDALASLHRQENCY